MKKLIFALAALCLFTACKDEDEFDYEGNNPRCGVHFYISDPDGNDLLDPENPAAFKEGEIAITYNNWATGQRETTHIGAYSEAATKDIIARKYTFTPPYVVHYSATDRHLVCIGEYMLPAQTTIEDEEITIGWPDGSQDILHLYYHQSLNKKKRDWDIDYRIIHNNQQMELDKYGCFTIVKKR